MKAFINTSDRNNTGLASHAQVLTEEIIQSLNSWKLWNNAAIDALYIKRFMLLMITTEPCGKYTPQLSPLTNRNGC
jgi:hypothetical protein